MTNEHKWSVQVEWDQCGLETMRVLITYALFLFLGGGYPLIITKGNLYLQFMNGTSKACSTQCGTHQPHFVEKRGGSVSDGCEGEIFTSGSL